MQFLATTHGIEPHPSRAMKTARRERTGGHFCGHTAYPHRFRHTFAINFLRNGGNAYALQMALGHASMDMVRKYLALAQTDIAAAHLIASPVANWRL